MEKTLRLFDEDSYIKEFGAEVISCEKIERGYETVLDRTAFFPEGGGQGADPGFLGETEVLHVREKDGVIYHLTESPFEVGQKVTGKIDFDERFRRMQNHTAEHILSGIIHSLYGFQNVGFHLSEEYFRADYDGELGREDIKKLEVLINYAIAENHKIRAWYPDAETLAAIEYRSKKDICGNVRLVEIENVDICACCAPHVAMTGEIGVFKVTEHARYKGGTRIIAVAGSDAVKLFINEHEMLSGIASSFSAKREDVKAAVDRLSNECLGLKREISRLNRELLQTKLSSVEPTDGNLCFFFDKGYDTDAVREFVNSAVSKCKGVLAAFIGDDENGYRYIIASETTSLKDNCKTINAAINGKGGGSPQMICGTARAGKLEIEEFFRENF